MLKYSEFPQNFPEFLRKMEDPISGLPNPSCSIQIPSLPRTEVINYSPLIFYSFPSCFEGTTRAFFTKFPHPRHPEVKESIVLEREVDPSTGVIYRKRKMVIWVDSVAPRWIVKLFGIKEAEFVEESHYDPHQKVLSISSRNVTFSSIIVATESSKFFQDPNDKNRTLFMQRGGIQTAETFGFLRKAFENFVSRRAREGGVVSCESLEERIRELLAQDMLQNHTKFD